MVFKKLKKKFVSEQLRAKKNAAREAKKQTAAEVEQNDNEPSHDDAKAKDETEQKEDILNGEAEERTEAEEDDAQKDEARVEPAEPDAEDANVPDDEDEVEVHAKPGAKDEDNAAPKEDKAGIEKEKEGSDKGDGGSDDEDGTEGQDERENKHGKGDEEPDDGSNGNTLTSSSQSKIDRAGSHASASSANADEPDPVASTEGAPTQKRHSPGSEVSSLLNSSFDTLDADDITAITESEMKKFTPEQLRQLQEVIVAAIKQRALMSQQKSKGEGVPTTLHEDEGDSTVDGTIDETIDGTIDETVDETLDETVDYTVDETVDETVDYTVDAAKDKDSKGEDKGWKNEGGKEKGGESDSDVVQMLEKTKEQVERQLTYHVESQSQLSRSKSAGSGSGRPGDNTGSVCEKQTVDSSKTEQKRNTSAAIDECLGVGSQSRSADREMFPDEEDSEMPSPPETGRKSETAEEVENKGSSASDKNGVVKVHSYDSKGESIPTEAIVDEQVENEMKRSRWLCGICH